MWEMGARLLSLALSCELEACSQGKAPSWDLSLRWVLIALLEV